MSLSSPNRFKMSWSDAPRCPREIRIHPVSPNKPGTYETISLLSRWPCIACFRFPLVVINLEIDRFRPVIIARVVDAFHLDLSFSQAPCINKEFCTWNLKALHVQFRKAIGHDKCEYYNLFLARMVPRLPAMQISRRYALNCGIGGRHYSPCPSAIHQIRPRSRAWLRWF